MDEQTVIMNFRLPAGLKKAFESTCKTQDRQPSQIMRDLMRGYVRDHSQLELEGVKGKAKK